MRPAVLLFIVGTTGAAVTYAQDAQVREQQRISMLKRISPTVVCVMPASGEGGGSGVLISADGYAISNYHVTSGSGNFMKCGLNDGRLYDSVIVGIDPTGDVALIKLLGRDDFPACVVGDSDRVQVGDEVVALGNPFLLAGDFTPTVTYGIVSGIRRYQYPANSFLEYTDCIQIDASINPGNSGGPLFDIDGRWIGINGRASFEKRGRINSGAAYAISVRQVQLFLDHLKAGRIVDHGRVDFTVATYDGVVEVQQVSELSEAWRRGLRPGDELVSFGDRSLSSANDFKNILGIFPEGTRVPLVFRNDEGVHKVTVRLLPLHDFMASPPIPEERPVERPKPEEQPGGEPEDPSEEHDHAAGAPFIPQQHAHLFEAREGFANHYFNRVETEKILSNLDAVIRDRNAAATETWVLQATATTAVGKHVGSITIGSQGAGLDLGGLNPELQSSSALDVDNESPQLFGLLFGALHWQRFFRSSVDQFADVQYFGGTQLEPSGEYVHMLLVKDGRTTSRWYFRHGEALPVGVDVQIGVGTDEGRLRFSDWKTTDVVPMPRRIGIVDADTENIRWIDIESVQFGPTATTQAVIGSEL